MRRRIVLTAVAAAVAAVAATAAAIVAAASPDARKVTLTLDWTPNPDHVGFYYARDTGLFAKRGLDVSIRAPADPTTPLKLVAAGKSDLAVSYEQELYFAAEKKLPVVAVAAVVPQPLNSLIALDTTIRSVRDLKGHSVGITGVPSDEATLETMLRSAGLRRDDVRVVRVGYDLLPALLAHRVDAVLGVYRNVEAVQLRLRGQHPTVIPVERAGVPRYDELVLVASSKRLRADDDYGTTVKRFVGAFLAGTAQARSHPRRALEILRHVTAAEPRFLGRATPVTLALLDGPDGVGCLSRAAWRRFGTWMHARKLLAHPVATSSVVTTRFLPARCSRRSHG